MLQPTHYGPEEVLEIALAQRHAVHLWRGQHVEQRKHGPLHPVQVVRARQLLQVLSLHHPALEADPEPVARHHFRRLADHGLDLAAPAPELDAQQLHGVVAPQVRALGRGRRCQRHQEYGQGHVALGGDHARDLGRLEGRGQLLDEASSKTVPRLFVLQPYPLGTLLVRGVEALQLAFAEAPPGAHHLVPNPRAELGVQRRGGEEAVLPCKFRLECSFLRGV
mmetsp:Transcript_18475/g.52228  ORF Transcript_18475/g.52228 Transcript_18475/m.52228 type:complete len:222 (-) Transcript_18475:1720-2385(-)